MLKSLVTSPWVLDFKSSPSAKRRRFLFKNRLTGNGFGGKYFQIQKVEIRLPTQQITTLTKIKSEWCYLLLGQVSYCLHLVTTKKNHTHNCLSPISEGAKMLLVVLPGQQRFKPAASLLSDLPQWWRKGLRLQMGGVTHPSTYHCRAAWLSHTN